MDWVFPAVNAFFALIMAFHEVRRRRVLALYWVLASYFGVAILADMASAPFGSGAGFVPVIMTQQAIGRVALFVFGSNVCFALGETGMRVGVGAIRRPSCAVTEGRRPAGHLIWVYLGLFTAGCACYLPQISGFSYSDYVWDNRWLLSRQIFFCSMPLGPLAVLEKRYWLAALPLASTVAIVLITHVRDPLLYSAFPLLIALMFTPASRDRAAMRRRMAAAGTAAVLLAGFGAYVMFLRTSRVSLPEFDLTRGMYIVFERVDGGVPPAGTASLEIAAKSIIWPVYNRHIIPSYSLPEDPPYYIARITTARQPRGRVSHFPFLWYSDAYLSSGWFGMLQGLLWGAVLAFWDEAARKNPVVWAVSLPFLTWTVYVFTRGVVGGAFSKVSPIIYTQSVILLAAYTFAGCRMTRRTARPGVQDCL